MRDFYAEIGDILGSGSTDYAIIPLGDEDRENAAHTICTTVGSGAGNGLTFTYRPGTRDDFVVPTVFARNQQRQPRLQVNGTGEEGDTPDTAFWSFISGGVDAAGSVGLWIEPRSVSGGKIYLGKFSTPKEWRFLQVGAKVRFDVNDESAGVVPVRQADSASSIAIGRKAFVVATYDGSGGASAMDGVTLYHSGTVLASTATNNASYVDMEDGTSIIEWCNSASTNFYHGLMEGGAIGPFKTSQELTAAQVQNLYDIGVAAQRAQRSPQLAGIF